MTQRPLRTREGPDASDGSHAGSPRAFLRRALQRHELWPPVRAGLWVLLLFAAALVAVEAWRVPLRAALADHQSLGLGVFVVTSAVAVIAPVLTNLPLVPLAVLAWGPAWTATLLLAGWVIGSMLSFQIGRHARAPLLRRFPSVMRHAQIDRLIHPRHRLVSLVMLRMTFPVDVLSYALGLFSPATTVWQTVLSTALGGAPFALLFAWFPTLSGGAQLAVLAGSVAAFGLYAAWVLDRSRPPS